MVISRERFEAIRAKYGFVASWAVWAEAGDQPKSKIGNMQVLDPDVNKSLISTIHTDSVMVALNFAREVEFSQPFMNFHDANPRGQDYKIRYAFQDTKFYGSYMTDVIKDFPMLSSGDVMKYLAKHPNVLSNQIQEFAAELEFIGAKKPKILAFGRDTYSILSKHLDSELYSNLVGLTHYSHHIGKEKYRAECLANLQNVAG